MRFCGKINDTFFTVLHHFDMWSFCDGGSCVVESFLFYSFHDYVAHIYILSTSVLVLYFIFHLYRYYGSDYRVLT